MNRHFLVILNAGLFVILLEGPLAGNTPFGAVLLLMFSGVLFSNGCWHLWASYKSKSYSPGTITGTLLYLALPFFQYFGWMRLGRISQWTSVAMLLIGTSYPLLSTLYHKQQIHEPTTGR